MNDFIWPVFVTSDVNEFLRFAQCWGLLDYVTGTSSIDPRLREIDIRVEVVNPLGWHE